MAKLLGPNVAAPYFTFHVTADQTLSLSSPVAENPGADGILNALEALPT